MQNQSKLDQLAEELILRRKIDNYGIVSYYNENNELHRVHGPAVIFTSGSKYWLQNDKRHRLDGPAVIFTNGDKYWYINDKPYTEAEFNAHPLVIEYAKSK